MRHKWGSTGGRAKGRGSLPAAPPRSKVRWCPVVEDVGRGRSGAHGTPMTRTPRLPGKSTAAWPERALLIVVATFVHSRKQSWPMRGQRELTTGRDFVDAAFREGTSHCGLEGLGGSELSLVAHLPPMLCMVP